MKIELVENWRKLWKAWTMWLAGFGIVMPDLLNVIAANTDLLVGVDDGTKSMIRLVCLIAIVLVRPVKQASMT